MPYITKEDRVQFENILLDIKDLFNNNGITPGSLNYLITKTCLEYLKYKGVSYTHYNDILGVLEGVKLELYRRQISSYEDAKKVLNGDVYEV